MFEDIDHVGITSNDVFGVATVTTSDAESSRDADAFFTVKKPKSFFTKSLTKRELGGNVTESKSASKMAKKYDERSDSMASSNLNTGTDFRTRVAVTFQEKLAVLEERDRYLRSRVYIGNVKNMSVIAIGTCPDMCPEKERLLREINCSFSTFEAQVLRNEMLVVPELLVKEYSRSSADQEEPLPHELRPEPVLMNTLRHLLTLVVPRIEDDIDQVDVGEWYHFCWDRLRSLRKDIIQQQLCSANIVQILECSARFHICCADLLHAADVRVFDEKINTENLVNCLQMLLGMYDRLKMREAETGCENEVEFRIYMALLLFEGSGDVSADLTLGCGHDPRAVEAVNLYVAFKLKLYSKFFKLVRSTSYLNACILQRYFGRVRMHALNALANAYSAGSHAAARFPLTFAKRALELSDDEETKTFVEAYGFAAIDEEIRASKASFTIPETRPVVKSSAIVRHKRTSVLEAICGDQQAQQSLIRESRTDVKVHSSFDTNDVLRKDAWLAEDQKYKVIELYGDVYAGDKSNVDEEEDKMGVDDADELPLEAKGNTWKSASLLTRSYGKKYADDKCEADEKENEMHMDEEDELSSCETAKKYTTFLDKTNVWKPPVFNDVPPKPVPSPFTSTFSFAQPVSELTVKSVSVSNGPIVVDSFKSETPPPVAFQPKVTDVLDEIDANMFRTSINKDNSNLYDPTEPLCYSSPADEVEDNMYLPSKVNVNHSSLEQRNRSAEEIYDSLTQELNQFVELYCNEETYDAKAEARRLRREIRRRLKHKTALKYYRLWRKKILAARKRHEEFVGVTHLSLDDYFRLWGDVAGVRYTSSSANASSSLLEIEMMRSDETRRWSSSLLNSAAIQLHYLGEQLSNSIAITMQKTVPPKMRSTRVCWKVIVSLPKKDGGEIYDAFEMRIRELCRILYYPTGSQQLGDVVATKCPINGTTVYTSVNVVIGPSSNSTDGVAHLLLLVHENWESWYKLKSRLAGIFERIISPIIMSVVTIGECSYRSHLESYFQKFCKQRILLEWSAIKWRNFFSVAEAIATAACSRRIPFAQPFEVQSLPSLVYLFGVEFFARLRAICEDCRNSPVIFIERYNRFIKSLSAILCSQNASDYNLAPEFVDAIVGGETTRTNLRANDLRPVEAILREYLLINFTKWPPKSTVKMEKLLVQYCERLDDEKHSLLGCVMRSIEWHTGLDVDAMSAKAPWLQITEMWFEYNVRRAANASTEAIIFYEPQNMETVIDRAIMEE